MNKKKSKLGFGNSFKKAFMKLSYILNKGKIENCIKKDSSEIDILCESPDWNASMINDDSLYDGDMLAEVDIHSLLNDTLEIPKIIDEMNSDKTNSVVEESDDMSEQLSVIRINKKRDEVSRLDRMMSHSTETIYETVCIDLNISAIKGTSKIPLTYKNTDCELIVNDETTILTNNTSIANKVIIKRADKYIKCLDDPESYPLYCLCITDEYYYSLFENIKSLEYRANAMRVFSRLSPHQKAFVVSMANRPKAEDESIEEKKSEGYSPIRDEKALQMMYQLCRSTYKPSVRARADSLFEQLHSARGTDRSNLINQIAYSIGIDTRSFPQSHKTFDEIIEIMDKHIYGMKDLKIAIAEFIIAMQYSGDPYCAILLVGPPGVGKTSVSNAIVECLGIPLVHIDCSGVDIISMSGLIKAYSGAKASKVMDAFYEVGRTDVVMLFDEIDKMEKGKEGDPYGALIKPLGPQRKYYDEYIAGDTDVSATKFIATANDINKIPGYILSRFESNIFTISPYTVDEKVEIARNHIIPKKLSAFNLSSDDVAFSDDALYAIAKDYCSDAGARELSGHITNLMRKVITEWSRGIVEKPLCIDETYVHEHLVSYKPKPSRRIGF